MSLTKKYFLLLEKIESSSTQNNVSCGLVLDLPYKINYVLGNLGCTEHYFALGRVMGELKECKYTFTCYDALNNENRQSLRQELLYVIYF